MGEVMRVSGKGQLTIPVSVRKKMKIAEGDYMLFSVEDNQIKLTKIEQVKPLSSEDPVWKMVGMAESGYGDVSVNHDSYMAEGELDHWKK